jgi:hypothetical protein
MAIRTDQPHRSAALGAEPIRTIDRDEPKARLDVRRYAGGLLDGEDAGLPLEGAWASRG